MILKNVLKKIVNISYFGNFLIAIIIILIFALSSSNFLSFQNAIAIALGITISGVMAIGMTIVLLSGSVVDLSIGAIMAASGIVTVNTLKYGLFFSIFSGLLFGVFIGFLNGLFVAKGKINPLITTLGTGMIVRGFAYVFSGGSSQSISMNTEAFLTLGYGRILGIPIPVLIFILLFIVTYLLIKYTIFGRNIYAIGGNPKASLLSGIKVDKWRMIVFIVSGFTAALSGIMMIAQMRMALPSFGQGIEFDVLTAVVLGGVTFAGGQGTILGTLLGLIIVGTLANGLVILNVNSFWQQVIKGIILLIAVFIDQLRTKR